MKKIFALVIAALLALSMVSAFAAGHTITVPDTDTHEYKVYQILTGKLNDAKDTLTNANWGTSTKTATEGKINGKTVVEFMKIMETLSGSEAVNTAMTYVDTTKALSGTVKAGTGMTDLAEGYYILVDVTNPLTNQDSNGNVISTDTKALSLLQLLDDVTVTKKWGTTTDTKIIDTDTLGKTGNDTNNINDDDDNVSIGDTVNYKITANVPENTDRFAEGTFFFVITDKMSAGLTFQNNIKVYIQGAGENGADLELAATEYTVKVNPNCVYDSENTFEVALKDAANAKFRGKTIIVKYSAVVNEDAVIGDAGNPNTSKVKFSNEPDHKYNGTPDQDGDGFPDTITDVPTGETPETETITYVTGIEILKVDENGEPLQGAKFSITGTSVKTLVTKTETFVVDETNGNYYKLKDNTYTMTAPTTENEMVAAQPGATKGYVVDAEATGTDVIEIGGTKYRPVKSGETPTHVLKVGSKDAYADNHKYKKTVVKGTVLDSSEEINQGAFVDANGLVRFDGLGAGTYTITETVTPDGYNTIDPITVTVTYLDPDREGAGTYRFDVTGGGATYEDNTIKVKIINKKGQKLPETGGMGTTILYIGGSILVLAAAILLVTKRRMNANND